MKIAHWDRRKYPFYGGVRLTVFRLTEVFLRKRQLSTAGTSESVRLREVPVYGMSVLMGEGFIGGVHPPSRSFLISDFVLQDMKNIFCQCYQNYLRHLWLKFFIFQMSERWFPWHPKEGVAPKGGVHTPHTP